MYFSMKNYLKNNHNHTTKHAFHGRFVCFLEERESIDTLKLDKCMSGNNNYFAKHNIITYE